MTQNPLGEPHKRRPVHRIRFAAHEAEAPPAEITTKAQPQVPTGTLRILVVAGKSLKNKAMISKLSKMHPYCVVKIQDGGTPGDTDAARMTQLASDLNRNVADGEHKFLTRVHKNGHTEPRWDGQFTANVSQHEHTTLLLQVWDKRAVGGDLIIGSTCMHLRCG